MEYQVRFEFFLFHIVPSGLCVFFGDFTNKITDFKPIVAPVQQPVLPDDISFQQQRVKAAEFAGLRKPTLPHPLRPAQRLHPGPASPRGFLSSSERQ